jgi:hypothetical protein
MTAFTDNTVALRHGDGSYGQTELKTMDSNSSDVSTSTELLAAVTGARHYIKYLKVTMCPGTTAVWFKVFSATTCKIGPVDMIDYHGVWEREYPGLGLEMGSAEAINIQTEAADQIHISMDYRTRYNKKPL